MVPLATAPSAICSGSSARITASAGITCPSISTNSSFAITGGPRRWPRFKSRSDSGRSAARPPEASSAVAAICPNSRSKRDHNLWFQPELSG